MTKVVALQTWSNGTITMEEKGVADIPDGLATDLIAKGIVAESPEYYGGGGSGGGVLVVHDVSGTLDKTWQEIYDAGFCVVATGTEDDITYMPLFNAYEYDGDYGVGAMTIDANNNVIIIWYMASSADGYPVHEPSA